MGQPCNRTEALAQWGFLPEQNIARGMLLPLLWAIL